MDKLKLIKTIIVFIILITAVYFIAQYYVSNKDKTLKKEIWSEIDNVFNGLDIVCVGEMSRVQVEQENIPKSFFGTYHGEDCGDLVSYYKRISGGFDILYAKKNNQNIEIGNFVSTNMGYKIYSYYNPSIYESYESAFDYLINRNGYRRGLYHKIQNIPSISNDYYSLVKVSDTYTNGKTPYIENDYYRVFFIDNGVAYSVELNKHKKMKEFWKIFGISAIGVLLLSFVLLYKPNHTNSVGK